MNTSATPDSPHLLFGHSSKAHYNVPLGGKTLDVTLANPGKLYDSDHAAFDRQVLMQLHVRLQRAVEAILQQEPDLSGQHHVQPDLRVSMPGEYLTMEAGCTSQRLSSRPVNEHRASLTLGSRRFEVIFPSPVCDMRTTRRAVQRLLRHISNTVGFDEITDEPRMTAKPVNS